ncbi:folate receptor family protein [Anaeramoeba flamelloides]|uniref:Folate receptor family protein n=1 Tax=Anaeramoeba flamelloides TaxID=1746091 RepID=A0AAV7YU53_9EUKA|nr:folate receptor family protein [Anaeramoeba flamelloides]
MSKDYQPLPNLPNNNQVPLNQNLNNTNMMYTNNNMNNMNNNMMNMNMNNMNMNNQNMMYTNNNMNMMNNNMNMNSNMPMPMPNNKNMKEPLIQQNTFSNRNRSPSSSDSESIKKRRKKLRKRQRRNRRYTIFAVVVVIIIIVIISSVESEDKNKNTTDGKHHGTGSPGLTCPPSEYYLNKTANNNLGCCEWYDYTCGEESSDTENNESICSDKKNYNEILSNQTSQCNDYLGLISCGPLSPYVNYFAPDISVGSDHQKMEICDTFCDTVYQECKSATFDCSFWNSFPHQHCNEKVSDYYSDGKSFCKDAIFLEYSTDHDNCFAPAGIFKANIFLMMLTICFLTFFWN